MGGLTQLEVEISRQLSVTSVAKPLAERARRGPYFVKAPGQLFEREHLHSCDRLRVEEEAMRRASALIICLAVAVAGKGQTVLGGDGPDAATLAAIAQERAVWGLSADLGVIDSIVSSGKDVGSATWGIVMTTAEAAIVDMPSRIAFGRDVHENLLPEIQALPTYGGAWFDQAQESLLTVALTAPDAAADKAIEAVAARHPQKIALEYVQNSYHALDAAAHDIWGLWADLTPNRELFTVSVDEIHNGLQIEVPEDQLASIDVATLRKSLGVPIQAIAGVAANAGSCPDRDHCIYPFKSATWTNVGYSLSDIRESCTIGFHITVGGSPNFLTSGHCNHGPRFYHKGWGLLGTSQASAYHNQGFDVQRVPLPSNQDSNLIYGDWHVVTGYYFPAIGDPVCAELPKSGFDCGTMTSSWFSYSLGGFTLWGAKYKDIHLQPGDSGSPFYYASQYGDATATGVGSCYFSSSTGCFARVGDALNLFGASLVIW